MNIPTCADYGEYNEIRPRAELLVDSEQVLTPQQLSRILSDALGLDVAEEQPS